MFPSHVSGYDNHRLVIGVPARMKRILSSLAVASTVGVAAVGLTGAFFSDSEISSDNTFTAGSLDLKVDNSSYYNGVFQEANSWSLDDLTNQLFFNFTDIKPGDIGEDTISLHVDDNPAWACYEFAITVNDDAGCTDPELVDDPTCDAQFEDAFDGELASQVHFLLWADDGDNVLEDDEVPFASGSAEQVFDGTAGALVDADTNVFGTVGNPMAGATTEYIGAGWCFGDLAQAPLAQDGLGADSTRTPANSTGGLTCDGSLLNNATQSDTLLADVRFYVEQYRNNPNFQCLSSGNCSAAEVFAATFVSAVQGNKKNGDPVNADRSIGASATGAPEGLVNPPAWYSLGFGGSIVVQFASPVGDEAGDDISIHEITGGRATYPEESALVEVSADGLNWYAIGSASSEPGGAGDGITYLDISTAVGAPSQISYVRVTDTTNPALHIATADGFDLDAVDAVYGVCE